jgi:hypothetical protein
MFTSRARCDLATLRAMGRGGRSGGAPRRTGAPAAGSRWADRGGADLGEDRQTAAGAGAGGSLEWAAHCWAVCGE